MSAAAPTSDETTPRASDRLKTLIIDQPLIMLGAILVLLVIACTIKKSSYFSGDQAGAILRYAAPLAIMACASDIEAPTVRIRPHDSLASNVFHDSTPMPGQSSTIAASRAGIAGDR